MILTLLYVLGYIVGFCVVGIIALILWMYYSSEKVFASVVNVKTGERMPGMSLFKSSYNMLVKRKEMGLIEFLLEKNRIMGDMYSTFLIWPTVVICDREAVKQVLRNIDEFPKQSFAGRSRFPRFKYINQVLGTRSILSVNNPEWHDIRTLLNPIFTSNKIFFDAMRSKVLLCAQKWRSQGSEVCDDLQKMTIDVLATCVFGKDFDTLSGKVSEPLAAYNGIIEIVFRPHRFIIPYIDYLPLPSNFKLDKWARVFDSYCWSVIDEAEKNIENVKNESLITLMLKNSVSKAVIRDNVGIFFLAGHETTAVTLAWAIGSLAVHTDIQKKAREEILTEIPGEITYESIKELEYIDCIIKETMRMYPAIPSIGQRMTPKAVTIGDWRIPANTMFELDLSSMLHKKEVWGDPDNFRPERWLPKNLTTNQRKNWIPFSSGPRICIGMNFSLLEQKIFLATILKEYSHFKLAPGAEFKSDPSNTFPRPNKNSLHIIFEKA